MRARLPPFRWRNLRRRGERPPRLGSTGNILAVIDIEGYHGGGRGGCDGRHALAAFPAARSFVSLVVSTHPESIRSPKRSIANLEFHRAGHSVDEVAHRVAVALAAHGHGHRSLNPPMAFPMEMSQFPGRTWVVSHKRVAVAAALGSGRI